MKLRKLFNMLFQLSNLIIGMYGVHILSDLIYHFISVVLGVYIVIGITMGSMRLDPTM